ncbi:hypothetical protein HK104_007106 [Borealophlyctis nickersoniae]|nr:hypothetical protein HK104_007106 [Borealophlyctis nickersoniae]
MLNREQKLAAAKRKLENFREARKRNSTYGTGVGQRSSVPPSPSLSAISATDIQDRLFSPLGSDSALNSGSYNEEEAPFVDVPADGTGSQRTGSAMAMGGLGTAQARSRSDSMQSAGPMCPEEEKDLDRLIHGQDGQSSPRSRRRSLKIQTSANGKSSSSPPLSRRQSFKKPSPLDNSMESLEAKYQALTIVNTTLTDENQSLRTRLQEFQADIDSLRNAQSVAAASAESLARQNDDLRERLSEAQSKTMEQDKQFERDYGELEENRMKLRLIEEDAKRAQSQRDIVEARAIEQEKELARVNAELADLRAKLSSQSASEQSPSAEEPEQVRQANKEAQETLEKQMAVAEELRMLNTQLREENERLRKIELERGVREDIDVEKAALEAKLNDLESLLKESREKVMILEAEVAGSKTRDVGNAESTPDSAVVEALQQDLGVAREQLSAYSISREEYERRIADLTDQIDRIQVENGQSSASLQQQLEQIQLQLESTLSEKQRLEQERGQFGERQKALVHENQLWRQKHAELMEKARKTVDDLNARGNAVVHERNGLRAQCEALRKQLQEGGSGVNQDWEEKVKSLQAELEESKREKEALAAELEAAKRAFGENEEKSKEDIAMLVDTMRDLTEQNGDLKVQLSQLTVEKEALEEQQRGLEGKLGSVERDLNQHSEQLRMTRSHSTEELAKREEIIDTLREKLEHVERTLADTTSQVSERDSRLEEAQTKFEDLRTHANSEIAARESRIAEMSQELRDRLAQADEERLRILEESKMRIDELTQQILAEEDAKAAIAREVDDLKAQIAAREDALGRVGQEKAGEIAKVMEERDEALNDLVEARAQLAQVEELLKAATEGRDAALASASAREGELSTLLSQKDMLVAKLQQVAMQRDDAAQQIAELQASLSDAEGMVDILAQEKETIRNAMGEAERDLRAQIAELETRCEGLLNDASAKSELQQRLEEAEAQTENLRHEVEIANAARLAAEERLQKLGADVEAAEKERESLAAKSTEQLDLLQSYDATSKELQSRVSTLEEQLAEAKKARDDLLEWKERATAQAHAIYEERNALSERCDSLVAELEDASVLHETEKEELHSAMAEVATRLAQLGLEKAGVEKERDDLLAQVARLEERLGTELGHLQQLVDAAREERDAAVAAHSDIRTMMVEVQEERDTVRHEKSQLEDRISGLREELASRDGQIEELNQRLNAVIAEKDQSSDLVDAIKSERDTALRSLEEATSRLKALQKAATDASEQVASLEEARDSAVEQLNNLSQQCTAHITRIESLEVELANAEDVGRSTAQERDALTKSVEDLQSRIADLESALESARHDFEIQIQTRHASAADAVLAIQNEKAEIEDLLRQAQTDLESARGEAKSHADELREQMDLVEELRSSRAELQNVLDDINQRMAAQRNAFAEEKEALMGSFRELEEETRMQVDDLVTTLKEVAAERDAMRRQADEAEAQLQAKAEEFARMQSEMGDTAAVMEREKKLVQELKAGREQLEAKVEELETDLDRARHEADSIAKEHEAAMSVRAALELRVQDLETAEIALRGQLDEAVELSTTRDDEVKRLRSALSQADAERRDVVGQLESELTKAKHTHDLLVAECDRAKAEASDALDRLRRSQDSLHETAAQFEVLSERLREEQDRAGELSLALADARLKLEDNEREFQIAMDSTFTATAPSDSGLVDDLGRRAEKLETERDQLRKEAREKDRVVDALYVRIGALEGDVASLTAALRQVKEENALLEEDVRRAHEDTHRPETGADDQSDVLRNRPHEEETPERELLITRPHWESVTDVPTIPISDMALHGEIESLQRELDAKSAELESLKREFEARLNAAEEKVHHYAQIADEATQAMEPHRDQLGTKKRTVERGRVVAGSDAGYQYEADDEGEGQRRVRREKTGSRQPVMDVDGLVSHFVGALGEYQNLVAALVDKKHGILEILDAGILPSKLPRRLQEDLSLLVTRLRDVEDQHGTLLKQVEYLQALQERAQRGDYRFPGEYASSSDGHGLQRRPHAENAGPVERYHLTSVEYFDLYERASHAQHYYTQLENAQALVKEHATEIRVLKEAIEALTKDPETSPANGPVDPVAWALKQRQVEELRKIWGHEQSANAVLRSLMAKTQTEAMRAQEDAVQEQAHLRAEFDELVALFDATHREADAHRSDAVERARRVREIERRCEERLNAQFFEHQEIVAAQEEMHAREREALEGLVGTLESERDKLIRDFSIVKKKLEEKLIEISQRSDQTQVKLEETERNLANAENELARMRNETHGRANEEIEMERRGLIAERSKLQASLAEARRAEQAARDREADVLARERTALERLERERSMAGEELRAAVASEQRRAREQLTSRTAELRITHERALEEVRAQKRRVEERLEEMETAWIEERDVLVRRAAEAEERERALVADLTELESRLSRRDRDERRDLDGRWERREKALLDERREIERRLIECEAGLDAERRAFERRLADASLERRELERKLVERETQWNADRQMLVEELARARDEANRLVADLGGDDKAGVRMLRNQKDTLEKLLTQREDKIRHLEMKLNDLSHHQPDGLPTQIQELEKDIQASVDTIRVLQDQLSASEDARMAAEAQCKFEKDRAKRLAFKLERQQEFVGGSRRSSDTRGATVDGAYEVEKLQRELQHVKANSREIIMIIREMLDNTVGLGGVDVHDPRSDKVKVDMTRLKEQCRSLISEFLYLRALVNRLSLWRADLKYQKLYLTLKVEDLLESHKATLQYVGVEAPGQTENVNFTPLRKWRRCTNVIISIHRMRLMAHNWQDVVQDHGQGFFEDFPPDEPITPLSSRDESRFPVIGDSYRDQPDTARRLAQLESEVVALRANKAGLEDRLNDEQLEKRALELENERLTKSVKLERPEYRYHPESLTYQPEPRQTLPPPPAPLNRAWSRGEQNSEGRRSVISTEERTSRYMPPPPSSSTLHDGGMISPRGYESSGYISERDRAPRWAPPPAPLSHRGSFASTAVGGSVAGMGSVDYSPPTRATGGRASMASVADRYEGLGSRSRMPSAGGASVGGRYGEGRGR